jgi:gluconolactonase
MITDHFKIESAGFRSLIMGNVHVEQLYTGCRWSEGPAYMPAGRYLVWSDIPNDRVMRWDETDGSVSIFQTPCNNQNGHFVDREGRLICCEHRGRRVTRIEHNGTLTVIADSYKGKRLNSPNDAVVRSDGTIWFTDPTYGIASDYEGDAAPREQATNNVYCFDPRDKSLECVATDFDQPNGLAFSPDESLLYIADTGDNAEGPLAHIRVFSCKGKTLSGGEVFVRCDIGLFDGFRVDRHGNIWTSAGDGVHCYAPDGTLLGRILIPEVVSNVCFGGPKRNRLFITATQSLYSVYLNTSGAGMI